MGTNKGEIVNNAIKGLVVVLSLPLLALGVGSMFSPAFMSGNLAVDPQGIPGLSTIRGDIGGLFSMDLYCL